MGQSTIELFATNEELIALAREFAIQNALWITIIKAPSLVVSSRVWASIETHLEHPVEPDERVEIVLTAIEPNLAEVSQTHDLLGNNVFPEWVAFIIACADDRYVLASRVSSWLSDGSKYTTQVKSLLRKIRKLTLTGYWAFTADLSARGYYTNLRRFTPAAKTLQDAGAKVSTATYDPPYVLGAECPYPLSEAAIVDRNARKQGQSK